MTMTLIGAYCNAGAHALDGNAAAAGNHRKENPQVLAFTICTVHLLAVAAHYQKQLVPAHVSCIIIRSNV